MINPSKKYRQLVLRDEFRSEIQRILDKHPRVEVAGFIFGKAENGTIETREVTFGGSSGWKKHCFSLSSDTVTRALAFGKDDPTQIGCVFHSHPRGSLFPSLWDVKSMIATGVPWLICGRRGGSIKFRVYIIESGVVREIRLVSK